MTKRMLNLGVLQCAYGSNLEKNIKKVTELVEAAAKRGAQVILPTELFEGPYFCREEKDEFFDWARPAKDHPTIKHFQSVAADLKVTLPVSFFEKEGPHHYNSIAMIDANGENLGIYRKSHIPDGPGYEEKFYFRPGNTGFKVWDTQFGKIGVGICWDQWYPECARAMALMGAEVLLYPTAIGSEPGNPNLDTKDLWQRAMIGHAVSNVIPVAAANRIGLEGDQKFYGSSFIANHRGEKVGELNRDEEGVLTSSFDLEEIRRNRASFGFFRDRRVDLYHSLLT